MSETTDMVPVRRGEIVEANQFAGLGATDVGASDIEMPRLKLLQALSHAVVEDKAKQGHWFNSLTEQSYGRAIVFVPVIGFKNRVLIRVGQGLQCRSLDLVHGQGNPGGLCAQCLLKEWPDDRRKAGEDVPLNVSGPECRLSHNWVGLVVAASDPEAKKDDKSAPKPLEEPEMAVLQLSSVASRAARKLNGLHLQALMRSQRAQWFERAYSIVSKQESNNKGNFFLPEITPFGKTDEETQNAAKGLLQFLAGKSLAFEAQEEDIADAVSVSAANVAAERADGDPDF